MKRILVILFACLLLWGCAREERQQPTEPTEPTQLPLPEVELTLWCPESYLGVMTREAERFAAAHAGEAVLTIHTEAMELSQVETRLYQDLDSGADLFVFSGSHLADMTRRGLLREVNDSMGAQQVLQPQAATVDGKLYG